MGAQLLAVVQLGLLAQESTAAVAQRRRGDGVAGWAGFVAAIVTMIATYTADLGKPVTVMVLVVLALLVAAGRVTLTCRRRDFTR